MQHGADVEQVTPDEAHAAIAADPSAPLVDVRTRAEWSFVGLADLGGAGGTVWPVEWRMLPGMAVNERFLDELSARTGAAPPRQMFFICRSGARSLEAARAAAAFFAARGTPVRCVNVAEGFEGDLDAEGHRGRTNGWKARGLPWRQT